MIKKFVRRRTSKLLTIKALNENSNLYNETIKIKPINSLKYNSITNKKNYSVKKLKKK